LRRLEATAPPIEFREVRLEIDVEPLGAPIPGCRDRCLDEAGADPAVPVLAVNREIEDRVVLAPVPGDIDEADETLAVTRKDRRDCAKALRRNLPGRDRPTRRARIR